LYKADFLKTTPKLATELQKFYDNGTSQNVIAKKVQDMYDVQLKCHNYFEGVSEGM